MHRLYRVIAVGMFFTAAACASKSSKDDSAREKILNQAAFDLQCDRANLTAQKISDDHEMMGVKNTTWGVRGCDKQATYKSSCGMGNCNIFNEAQLSNK
ncbi:hypothetical protein SAMN02745121_05481 [Nannocystis exedens]|uniref:Lipoprotein n=2 Tax=Nannocystis exedens TaxID=54 RepID=A0A1I2D9V9_9BACT|nr:hypothetical protein NAEX_03697 [Nannocystis exedens]SFE77335.1 hypothetical protein SAMN02745121_05481 [Nannocystis exedens]